MDQTAIVVLAILALIVIVGLRPFHESVERSADGTDVHGGSGPG